MLGFTYFYVIIIITSRGSTTVNSGGAICPLSSKGQLNAVDNDDERSIIG